MLLDGESGDLLALVAGRDLNVWRTGAPAGVARPISCSAWRRYWVLSAGGDRRAGNLWRLPAPDHR